MSSKRINLKTATPVQISAAVTEHVAGWKQVAPDPTGKYVGLPPNASWPGDYQEVEPFATSADAVTELEQRLAPTQDERECCEGRWVMYCELLCEVCGYNQHDRARFAWSVITATPMQRCIALLRASGVEVVE